MISHAAPEADDAPPDRPEPGSAHHAFPPAPNSAGGHRLQGTVGGAGAHPPTPPGRAQDAPGTHQDGQNQTNGTVGKNRVSLK